MTKNDLFYQIALTLVPHIGSVQARILIDKYGDAKTIFHTPAAALEKTEGIGTVRAKSICSFNDFDRVEKEMRFIKHYKIQSIFLTDPAYPKRLLNCYDPPTILYYKGNEDLNASRIISVIGTRTNSVYGKQLTEKLITELTDYEVLIVSGLAFGIDAIAHSSALKNGLSTIGVLAHGLDTIYPPQHTALAKDMMNQGGLLTEFTSNVKPDKHNFPSRNRIVAGISDATIVIETGEKGGSMITAELANSYGKDVFAYPGKVTDAKSAGCNYLIKSNKAILITDTQQLLNYLGWEEKKKTCEKRQQKVLFINLSAEEKIIINILKEKETVHIDELNIRSALSASRLATAVLSLEIQDIIASLPGKMYKLI